MIKRLNGRLRRFVRNANTALAVGFSNRILISPSPAGMRKRFGAKDDDAVGKIGPGLQPTCDSNCWTKNCWCRRLAEGRPVFDRDRILLGDEGADEIRDISTTTQGSFRRAEAIRDVPGASGAPFNEGGSRGHPGRRHRCLLAAHGRVEDRHGCWPVVL